MGEEPAAQVQLLRSQKTKLLEILSADPDFVLQHADSRFLLSPGGYQQVKSCRIPSEKVTELLDHIIQRGAEAVQGFLELLKERALQETFPMLTDVQVNTQSPGRKQTSKRKRPPEAQEVISFKKPCNNGSVLVKEKQLMSVARAIGKSWREIGRMALDIPTVKLEQIEEDHSTHVERVFAMLRYWRTCQREKATAAQLHSLLSHNDWALPPESIDFLLETD
ncbi:uncharacterized protein LOC114438821 [Parambassis ranga]|uniref:Uncharacterized protein LOC114438821 n=1 Tax=Parambassis ranga TaxID=210632 RepID=A0A6P7IRR2_9TELE|nr:uncharacterized protein LOC114438821 [Parambassis ranga]XP_028266203.1 uncharacterized protein LOC114438821 [Parambassis ranga]XP_028266204.1 uncharacterized protein LOC114438821 [Parambassis ranga]